MKQIIPVLFAMMALTLGGCGDSHDSLMADQVNLMKKMVATLEGIKDEATAKSAKSTLESLGKQMKDIQDRAGKLPTPSEAEGKALLDKHGKELGAAMEKFVKEMMRVGLDPKIGPILQDVNLEGLGK